MQGARLKQGDLIRIDFSQTPEAFHLIPTMCGS
jgi:hypothetical protein